jgi:hypothetical protein
VVLNGRPSGSVGLSRAQTLARLPVGGEAFTHRIPRRTRDELPADAPRSLGDEWGKPVSFGVVERGRLLVWLAVIAGVALIVLAVVYWVEPAKSLPSWIPGHEAGSNHHHVKHGIAAFLVGVACLVFAWFRSAGPRPRSAAV